MSAGLITAAELAERLSDLVPIGRDETGATTRLAWTPEDEAAAGWFARQAGELGRRLQRDAAGNLWAPPPGPPPWWGVGSHLDSVRHGGRFDGALGVAAAFAVAARAPVAVVSFADEEGARFNTPTFGSRALAGRLDVDDVLSRVDDRGVVLGDAMAAAGVDPEGLRAAPAALERLRGFIELHIDQTRDLEAAGAPAGVVARLAARMRLQVELTGRADHAGTTRRADRRDALAAAARLMVRADELAAERADMVSTTGRIEVEPNAPTTVPSLVRLWIDARAPRVADVESWERALADAAREIGARTGVGIAFRVASRSDGVEFDGAVRRALAEGLAMSASGLRSSPVAFGDVTSYAGHDAGILGERIPAGMIFVRNPTGVSHAPEEEVSLEDAAVGANALLAAVEALR